MKNGRPQVHFITEKPCANCQRVFTMAACGVKHPSQFVVYRYCSAECRLDARLVRSLRNPKVLRECLASKSEDAPNGCRIWNGRRTSKGYGVLIVAERTVRAHRAAYELANGPIPAGLMLLHGCDNPPCINPAHLRPGTAQENRQDCISRGRAAFQQVPQGSGGKAEQASPSNQ